MASPSLTPAMDETAPNATSSSSQTPPPPGTLETFFHSTRATPQAVAISQEVRDRGSIFIAHLFQVTTLEEAQARVQYVKCVLHGARRASHESAAWRCMIVKEGRSGLGGPDDFELKSGSKDDGERWAGDRILKVMQAQAVIDAVVVVSRWFGGTLLGPARFTHIETCATEVCREFKRSEELRDCVSSLTEMDVVLARIRSELAAMPPSPVTVDPHEGEGVKVEGNDNDTTRVVLPVASSSIGKKMDYTKLDVARAKKLIRAREGAIKSVKNLLAKRRKEQKVAPT